MLQLWEIWNACRIFVRKPEGKNLLVRSRIMWQSNINLDAGKPGFDKFWIKSDGGLLWTW
jgi:hypothetical protein